MMLRIVGVLLMMLPVVAGARVFQTPLDQSQWSVASSIFECSLTHEIPYYGQAVFLHKAGESSNFSLHAVTTRLKTGKALLASQSPMWRPGQPQLGLGYIPVAQGLNPVNLGARLAEQMLAELKEGRDVVITRRPWYGPESTASLDITMSTVSFRAAYRQYLECLAGLLPVNFDQIARQSIYFTSGSEELKASERRKLDNVIIYVKADPSVEVFYVDGHTDSVGASADNLELAKSRADMVSAYLIRGGIAEDRIVTRWHGERYPVATNATRQGRAMNRRVTIRLERVKADALPDIARAETAPLP